MFTVVKVNKGGVDVLETQEVELICTLDDNDYIISVGSDGYFNCFACSKEIQKALKDNYIDFRDVNKSREEINSYFQNKNGICE